MPNIEEILSKHKIELEDDALKAFKVDLFKDYKSAAEVEAAQKKANDAETARATAEKERDDYKAIADAFEGEDAESIKKLKDDYATLDQKVKDRDEAEQAKAAQSAFESQFDTAIGDKKFANDLVKSSVMSAVQAERKNDPVSGLSELIDKVTKDKDGIFANPNKPNPNPLPGKAEAGEGEKDKPEGTLDDAAIRRIAGLPDDYKLD